VRLNSDDTHRRPRRFHDEEPGQFKPAVRTDHLSFNSCQPTKGTQMQTSHSNPLGPSDAPARLGIGPWIILIVLLLLLAATCLLAYVGWTLEDGVAVPAAGYVAMAFGVLFSIVIGCGLMALIFYSSRSGYDEPPVLIAPENKTQAPDSSGEPSMSQPTHTGYDPTHS
jgi:hypothetical protein